MFDLAQNPRRCPMTLRRGECVLEVGNYVKLGGWAWWWFLAEREEEEGRKKKETRRRQAIGMHGRYGADLGVVKREGTTGVYGKYKKREREKEICRESKGKKRVTVAKPSQTTAIQKVPIPLLPMDGC